MPVSPSAAWKQAEVWGWDMKGGEFGFGCALACLYSEHDA